MHQLPEPEMWGLLVTLTIIVVAILWEVTKDTSPTESRAKRCGVATSIASLVLVMYGEWALYLWSTAIGGFFLAPSALMAVVAMIISYQKMHRACGGNAGMEKQESATPIKIEPATLEHQGTIWCQLRTLPHMRETLDGELISLLTGDRLTWKEFTGQRCITIQLAGNTSMIGSKYETLTKYLTVQESLARTLGLA